MYSGDEYYGDEITSPIEHPQPRYQVRELTDLTNPANRGILISEHATFGAAVIAMKRTPRQWLIEWAVQELKRGIRNGSAPADRLQAARLAMEIVTDNPRRPGTLGRAIHDYYVNATETARERLDATIARLVNDA